MYVRTLGVVLSSVFVCVAAQGQLLNSSFEIPDPARATEWFTPPLHWDWYDLDNNWNYVGLHSAFTPKPEFRQTVNWSIPAPVDGNYFVLLSTGDSRGPGSSERTIYSRIEQHITLCPDDMLSGHYFFGTCDFVPYNDTGLIMLKPADPNDGLRPIVLVKITTEDVGDYKSTDGWQPFHYRHKSTQCDRYILVCEVKDELDKIYKSYLALDNFRLCHGLPIFGDLNIDCAVDYHDFNILAKGWLADCNDPNVIADPNIPCDLLVPDPNTINGFIDIGHMMLLSEHWLERFD